MIGINFTEFFTLILVILMIMVIRLSLIMRLERKTLIL